MDLTEAGRKGLYPRRMLVQQVAEVGGGSLGRGDREQHGVPERRRAVGRRLVQRQHIV
ncbi:MAG: hypothetical protein U0531_16880 [Dehalococcoidia bacterium]